MHGTKNTKKPGISDDVLQFLVRHAMCRVHWHSSDLQQWRNGPRILGYLYSASCKKQGIRISFQCKKSCMNAPQCQSTLPVL